MILHGMVAPRTRIAALAIGIATISLAVSAITAPAAYAGDGDCSGDSCDGNLWQAARGDTNQNSYWGMDSGHNCTNYVAWKLISNGVERPAINPGNASDWAARAILAGYLVDDIPSVGAVAQWDSYAGGNGVDGHVAYVERINSDGTILVSEDYWHGGDQSGPLTFRTTLAAGVSHFIHYGDVSQWLRELQPGAAGWQQRSIGITVTPTAMTLETLPGKAPQLYYLEDGLLHQAVANTTGWHDTLAGLASTSTTLSAVNMGDASPRLLTVEQGLLYLNVNTGPSWQKMNTGIAVSGDISAVDLGGLLPTVMVSQGGTLYRIWGDADGWHSESTGVESWGPISALNVGGTRPEVYGIESNMLHRAWWDSEGWHTESTGLAANGAIVAVDIAGSAQLVLSESGTLYRLFSDTSGWHKEPLGVAAGTILTAADTGTGLPLILQAG